MAQTGLSKSKSLQEFLLPLHIDLPIILALAASLSTCFKRLAAESTNQFLPTPVTDAVLDPSTVKAGRYLAVDIGGTNLRVGFIELSDVTKDGSRSTLTYGMSESRLDESRVRRISEKSWHIQEHLKYENAEDLFAWIGACIAEVVEDSVKIFASDIEGPLPMGVTFSFPMIQETLQEATLMKMGKSFSITSNLNLGRQLREGYSKAERRGQLPEVEILAIVNDTVATLISFAYQLRESSQIKASMGLIVGTGSNATIPLALNSLHPAKRPREREVHSAHFLGERKVLINTEWGINGTAAPLEALGLVTSWDKALDAAVSVPGFQPFEYMTAGRYLGELCRLTVLDYFISQLQVEEGKLPAKLRKRNGLTTTFLGKFGARQSFDISSMVAEISRELPPPEGENFWEWTAEASEAVYQIAKAIQVRGAGLISAAIIGLLTCAEELSFATDDIIERGSLTPEIKELLVGYTGGCIVHFQDYLVDCQGFLDQIMHTHFQGQPRLRVVLQSCHDGGIVGAGVLAATVKKLKVGP